MALVRWEPAREVDSLQSEVNRVFDAFFGNGASRTRRWWRPTATSSCGPIFPA